MVMIIVEKKRLGFSVKPCVLSLQFEMQRISHELMRGSVLLLFQGYFAHSVLWLFRGKGSAKPYLLFVGSNGEALLASPCLSWDPLTLLHSVYLCFWCVPTDHNPPFFAFSSCLHFPKSIYEGNFGCGYLKERRASGLVFCENTTSVYRALFVSPPAPSSVFIEDCPSVAGSFCAVCSLECCACYFHFLA